MNEKTENINYIILADWVRHTWFELQSKGNYDSNKKAKKKFTNSVTDCDILYLFFSSSSRLVWIILSTFHVWYKCSCFNECGTEAHTKVKTRNILFGMFNNHDTKFLTFLVSFYLVHRSSIKRKLTVVYKYMII